MLWSSAGILNNKLSKLWTLEIEIPKQPKLLSRAKLAAMETANMED